MRQLVVMRIAPGKVGEFLLLVLPCRAVVAVEVRVFLQLRVTVGGKHLPVGVNVDPFSVCLRRDSRFFKSWPEMRMALPFFAPRGTFVGVGWP